MTTFKTFTPNDVTSTRTLLNEAIPITGSIVSGTYNDNNIKNYSHGYFQSVYDYPYLSSSANHIFDITVGYSATSVLSSSTNVENAKKINIYNQMAQVLVGHDVTGSILEFDQDGDIVAGGTKFKECIFLTFSRLTTKDEIKKGSVSLNFYTGGSATSSFSGNVDITDSTATTAFKTNSPVGEYGFLSASDSSYSGYFPGNLGLVYYQAGVAVLTASIFNVNGTTSAYDTQDFGAYLTASSAQFTGLLTGSTIQDLSDGIRNRLEDIDFNNTVELNSTVYFVRANHNEFNYSANPTYLSESKIRTKNISTDEPVSYITTVGLYSPDGVLLAVGKLSEPIKKTPATEFNIRARLDY